ncbi:MAG: pgk, phosphoglycerate kinase [Candidatus Saccharibacteria bacterium]|jgi:3-phosphoglycerate kinase|nr:pgk, phosphoglycerate kinase [Candidatus Saccharibacteria bacterium]
MKFFKQTINTVPLQGQTVLLRADYNVPLKKDGSIDDDFRIRASLPTVKKLLADGCKVVIISHLGRPEGRYPKLSLEPIAQRLAEYLGESVRFVDQTIGDKVKMAIKRAPKRSVIVLENLRYYPEEEANDSHFAQKLAENTGARYFVQDGFGVVHRAHASTAAITDYLPGVAGLLLEREYTTITKAMKAPKRPLVAVMGGAKVSDKIDVITEFISVADTIIIGGAMANTFLAYKGYAMGKSKFDTDENATLDQIYAAARDKVGADNVDKFIILPTDLAIGHSLDSHEQRINKAADQLAADDIALDIGDKSIEKVVEIAAGAETVVWNGTLGYAEVPNFAHGSARLALALATNPGITSIIGGGDTADFVLNWDARKGDSFTHVSTGGGASLELMAGEKLPGIESLLDAR